MKIKDCIMTEAWLKGNGLKFSKIVPYAIMKGKTESFGICHQAFLIYIKQSLFFMK